MLFPAGARKIFARNDNWPNGALASLTWINVLNEA